MHQSVREAFLPFSEPLESRENFMYLDIKSLVSTGVGNLLDADNPESFGSNPRPLPDIFTLDWFDEQTGVAATRDEIEKEYQKVKFSGTARASIGEKKGITRLRISESAIDALVTTKLNSFENTLRAREPFAAFDSWPADGQLGLLSMAWAMGPKFSFPNFQRAAPVGDWSTMARECRMRESDNPGVIPRNVRNGLLFTLAGWNSSPPPGDFAQLIFDPKQRLDAQMRSGTFPVPLNLAVGVQTALERLGFNPNGLDGIVGKGTRAALTSFQGTRGVAQTPMVGSVQDIPQETITALAAGLDDEGISHIP
ncbi:peptidoglycan-binding protein [Streptomyces sp. NPDC002787]